MLEKGESLKRTVRVDTSSFLERGLLHTPTNGPRLVSTVPDTSVVVSPTVHGPLVKDFRKRSV